MKVTSPFKTAAYLGINRARWAAARRILVGLRTSGWSLDTCLDVGCGQGWFSERLAHLGLRVDGLDGRPDNVAEARRRVPGARFRAADIVKSETLARLPSYDLVFCFGLLYHTETPFMAVRNLRRLTRELLLLESIVLPDLAPCACLVDEGTNETQGLTFHAFIPSQTCLVKMLQAAGFPHVHEYVGSVAHADFHESETRHRKRRILVAANRSVAIRELAPIPPVAAPKRDFWTRLP
ncbi:MAG: class I SAM-dependent methyltransferase [Candidatus Rokuibacteriota bacterium]